MLQSQGCRLTDCKKHRPILETAIRMLSEGQRKEKGKSRGSNFGLVLIWSANPYNLGAVSHCYLKVTGSKGELVNYNYYHHVLSSPKCSKSATATIHATASVPTQTDTNSVTKLNVGLLCNTIFKCQHVTFVSQNEGKLK